MLTLLTATGCRPEAWAICAQLAANQDYQGPVRWVIVDDGPEPQPYADCVWLDIEIIRPEPFWKPGQNTQARNLAAGLERIGDDEQVIIWEDDDYYASGYLSAVAEWLSGDNELVGESHARYYNVATGKGKRNTNSGHASLCSTAMKGEALSYFRRCVEAADTFIDINLWRGFKGRKKLYQADYVVGIKGLPGRAGIGVGHRPHWGEPMDPRPWLGADASLYGL